MKIIKRILLVIVVLIGVAAIIGFMMPKDRHTERSIVVQASPDVVYAQVDNLKSWDSWSPWKEIDPNAKMEYSNPASGTGSWYTWSSDNREVGHGKLTVEESVPGKMVKTRVNFEDMTPSYGIFSFTPEGTGTKVTWSFDASLGNNPFFRLMGPMMDKMMGQTFEKGLAKMKTVSESMPAVAPATVVASTDSVSVK